MPVLHALLDTSCKMLPVMPVETTAYCALTQLLATDATVAICILTVTVHAVCASLLALLVLTVLLA